VSPEYPVTRKLITIVALVCCVARAGLATERPRLRDLGIEPGILDPGPLNAITDVEGVKVGHRTLIEGQGIRTGVTAIVPHGSNVFQSKVPAAVFPANAYGKAAGFLQVQELGNLETPIVLTNTLCVGTAVQAVVDWTLRQPGNEDLRSVNAVVGETNDGYLNDIRTCAVRPLDVYLAIEGAESGPVPEGSVGAGTGTIAFGFKGGIGTASRVLPESLGGFTVGALVQSNFGGILTIDGMRVGEALGSYAFRDAVEASDGSCMIVLATDAPLSPRNLERLAARAVMGLARTGSFMSNGSGDFVIAFSTQNQVPYRELYATRNDELLFNDLTSPLFLATVEAVEEAVLNSIIKATTVTGHDGNTAEAFPVERLVEMVGGGEKVVGQEEHDKRVDYVEFPVTDMEAAKAFYSAVFGWKMQDWGPDYASFEDGRLSGGFRLVDEVHRGGPLVIIYAVDLEAVKASVEAHGGTVVQEIFSFPGGRRFHFTDPSGNELAVWSDK
jgi:D-aminopeptidase